MPESLTPQSRVTGARVRELRRRAGLTQEQLGECIGLTKASTSAMEIQGHGLDSVSRLTALADAFGLSSVDPLFQPAGSDPDRQAPATPSPAARRSPLPGALTPLQAAAVDALTAACKQRVVPDGRLIELLTELHALQKAAQV